MSSPWGKAEQGLREWAAVDVSSLPDATVRSDILAAARILNVCYAVLWRRVASFHRRGLAGADGCRSTAAWLRGFGRFSVYTASGLVAKAEVVDQLPLLREAVQEGRVSTDHLSRLLELANDVGLDAVGRVEDILTGLCDQAPPEALARACDRVRDHVNPDRPEPDPEKLLARRHLTLSRSGNMVQIRGQLDPEGGAMVMTALDAAMSPPAADDPRTAKQRRADALVELLRVPLQYDLLPQVAGNRPHVALLLTPDELSRRTKRDNAGPVPEWVSRLTHRFDPERQSTKDDGVYQGAAEPGLEPEADVEPEAYVEPETGVEHESRLEPKACVQPLDVGRTHRTATYAIRHALHARDRGCRWPGCSAPDRPTGHAARGSHILRHAVTDPAWPKPSGSE